MAGKRVRSDDDLHSCSSEYEQRPSRRARYDADDDDDEMVIVDRLQGIINQQIEAFGPDYVNLADRLESLVQTQRSNNEQHGMILNNNMSEIVSNLTLQDLITTEVEMLDSTDPNLCERLEQLIQTHANDSEQIGTGLLDPVLSDPTGPFAGLSQNDVDRLARDGGVVGGYTVVPRPYFNGLELHRDLNLREISSPNLAAYTIFVQNVLSEMVSFSRQMAGQGGFINISLRGPSLKRDVNAVLSPGNDYTEQVFVDQFEAVMQSNEGVMADDSLQLHVSIARSKNGGVRRKIIDIAHDDVFKRKKMHLFCPNNVGTNLCFAICLAHFLEPQTPHHDLEGRAMTIQNAAGFTSQSLIGFNDVAKFEKVLNIKIVVFHRSSDGRLEKYKTHEKPHPKTVFLYLHDSHYYMIKKLTAFIGSDYVCEYCYAGSKNRQNHECKFACSVCNDSECHRQPKNTIHCPDCLRFCKSQYCFNAHKLPVGGNVSGRSLCDTIKYCSKCSRRYYIASSNPQPHKCPAELCLYCGDNVSHGGTHECFIQPTQPKELDTRYIYYDFESRSDNGKHVANYASAMTFDGKKYEFRGEDCVKQLINKFRQPKFKNYTLVAHNASGFDNFLILEYFCKVGLKLKILMLGCRLLFMFDEMTKQRYIDSYSFLPMALAKTSAALNLTTAEKGYFPHLFNRLENQSYVGPYPAKHYYGYNNMTDSARTKFDQWYDTLAGKIFDFRKEIGVYCMNDVVLLREACMKYREEFIQCTQIDPFSYTTLASCCMGVFKTHFLKPNTIALTHNNAYVQQHKTFSNASIEWLEYVKKTRGVDIHHALNHGEMKFGSYYVDGYYEKDGVRKALDFAGCFFHGHCCRYRADYINPQSKIPFGTLMTMFNDRIDVLQRVHHLDTEVMWECRWTNLKQTDPDVIDFMSTYSAPERLKPRDSLFGGRTNAYKLYHKTVDGEKIRYVDFTSLYPYCQARKSYPIGHPEIIFSDFENLENYYGLVKVKMLPPRKLLYPVLPIRSSGKLMFSLCRTCAEEQSNVIPCTHTDDERAILGTWVSLELLKAIEKGYAVVKIYEVWHFPQRSDRLFCDYVKTFLQFKQQASGYPSDVITEDDKRGYIDDYHKKEGIKLDAEKIAYNPAQRSVMKLLLNSLWGRFCLRENLANSKLLKNPEDFAHFIFGCQYEIKYFTFLSDSVALVQYKHAEGSFYETRDVNVFIGAFTTAHARLELYDLMDKLGDRLLYSDTDSVIYVSREGDWEPPLGPYLGELTDEVGCDDYITEYCSGGPKTYGFRTAKGKVCMKAKGITLNSENSKVIRLDSLISLVNSYVNSSDSTQHILAHTDNIVRNKKTVTLHNKSVVKRFKVVYNKRVLLPDYRTLPYGY